MRAKEFITEGGWTSTSTQGTVITPSIVKNALTVIRKFTDDFNVWLSEKGIQGVEVGKPTGSTAYHEVDPDGKVYGDIDLQMIAPETQEGLTSLQFSSYWNKLADEFIAQTNPLYIHPTESKTGHPIVKIGDDNYVQIDFMWHPPRLSDWGATRATPERGIKGLLTGNMFSVLGEILDMSIQHAGVQLKVSDGKRVPFSKRKDTQIVTITTNPKTFILDIFKWLAERQGITNPNIDRRLVSNPGININNVKISSIVQGVKGLAQTLQMNNMYGKEDLVGISSAGDFMAKFINKYTEKAEADISNPKRDKAESPEALARAEADRKKVKDGLELVLKMFGVVDTVLNEMPLQSYRTLGDFSKTGPFRKTDKKLIPHPKTQLKAQQLFQNTPYDFRLFFSNIPGTGKYAEAGVATEEEIRKIFKNHADDILQDTHDSITVVYVGNSGDDKVMLTPWMMAHRFGHSVAASSTKVYVPWRQAEDHFFTMINDVLEIYYRKQFYSSYHGGIKKLINYDQTAASEYNALFNAIGTQRSSRKNRIRRPYEFFYEIFAQHLTTGHVKLNPLPEKLVYGHKAWGKPSKYLTIDDEYGDQKTRAQITGTLARDMEFMFNDVLSSCVGNVYVM